MKTFLVIDVGNTNVKYALMRNGKQLKFWSHPTADTASSCGGVLCQSRAPVALCSVVPEASALIRHNARDRELLEVSASTQTVLKRMHPAMGGDRVAAALASWKIYGKGRKSVVSMTFGTATTLLAIDKQGNECGGWIHPGVSMTLEALHRCALLPLFQMKNPSIALGHDTATHTQNGVFLGHIGLVKEYLKQAAAQLGVRDPLTVATGGWAQTLQDHGALFHHVDPQLTLKGIYLMAVEMHSGKKSA